jgi:hypothetical protein
MMVGCGGGVRVFFNPENIEDFAALTASDPHSHRGWVDCVSCLTPRFARFYHRYRASVVYGEREDFRYAVEIHNAGLVGPDSQKVLEAHGVAHGYNHWSYMPPLAKQYHRVERFTAPFSVLRLLTPLKISPQQFGDLVFAPHVRIMSRGMFIYDR